MVKTCINFVFAQLLAYFPHGINMQVKSKQTLFVGTGILLFYLAVSALHGGHCKGNITQLCQNPSSYSLF